MATFEIPDTAIQWLRTGERGLSSQAIFDHLTGRGRPAPSDPDDLRRCLLLLDAVPEFKARFVEMATASPRWAGLVADWENICALFAEEAPSGTCPKTYRAMKVALGEADKQPGWSISVDR